MHLRLPVLTLCAALALGGCALRAPAPSFPVTPGHPSAPGTAQPGPGTPAAPTEASPVPAPEKPYTPAPKQFRLGGASQALVTQAHQQSAAGDNAGAAATLERALRIEPDNPLLWTELGRIRMEESNPAQAESLGRKALSLSTGDPAAQSSAWHLIGDALRARGKNGEAADADRHAAAASPHAG